MKPQVIQTETGEELIVLTRREYDLLLASTGDEDAEDRLTIEIAGRVKNNLAAGTEEWIVRDDLRTGRGS